MLFAKCRICFMMRLMHVYVITLVAGNGYFGKVWRIIHDTFTLRVTLVFKETDLPDQS